jgi:hypothetical protein
MINRDDRQPARVKIGESKLALFRILKGLFLTL